MNNFKPKNWNRLNSPDRWDFLQNTEQKINGVGVSYFIHNQEDFDDMIDQLHEEYPRPVGFWDNLKEFFSSERGEKIRGKLIKEKIIQGFEPITLSVVNTDGRIYLDKNELRDGLKKKFKHLLMDSLWQKDMAIDVIKLK